MEGGVGAGGGYRAFVACRADVSGCLLLLIVRLTIYRLIRPAVLFLRSCFGFVFCLCVSF